MQTCFDTLVLVDEPARERQAVLGSSRYEQRARIEHLGIEPVGLELRREPGILEGALEVPRAKCQPRKAEVSLWPAGIEIDELGHDVAAGNRVRLVR